MMMMGYVDEALNRHKERMRPMVEDTYFRHYSSIGILEFLGMILEV